MHLSITPAPRGNTASPSLGGDTTFKRGESLAGIVSSPEACSAQERLVVLFSQAAGGKWKWPAPLGPLRRPGDMPIRSRFAFHWQTHGYPLGEKNKKMVITLFN